jgi:Periplasmic copper-binding protein (NosD)
MPYLRALLPTFLLPALLSASLTSIPVLQPSAKRVNVSTVSALVSAIGSASKGTTIMLADGTYDISKVWPLRFRTDSVQLYGASQDPTRVILKGAGFKSSNTDEELIKIEAVGIKLAYFTLRDGRANGVKVQTGANHWLFIHNVYFIDICERSIKAPDAAISKNGVVEYCLFQQVTPITADIPNLHMDGDYIAGMDMMKIEGWSIHDNVFKNIRGMHGGARAAIFLWNGCKNTTVERNVFLGCDRSIALGNPSSANLDMDGGIIRNNFIVAGKDISVEVCNSTGSLIASNTIYSTNPAYTRTVCFNNNRTGNILKDNLVLGKLAVLSGQTPDMAGNLFASSVVSSWFLDASNADLHLTSAASQAIDKGVPLTQITTDFDGAARSDKPDIGADEMGAVALPKSGAEMLAPMASDAKPDGSIGLSAPANRASMAYGRKSAWFTAKGQHLLVK